MELIQIVYETDSIHYSAFDLYIILSMQTKKAIKNIY